MTDKKIRLLIVTNSIPLPVADFLRDKVLGLSKVFDVHLMSYDKPKTLKKFVATYPNQIAAKNIHLYHSVHGIKSKLNLLSTHLGLLLSRPAAMLSLIKKINRKDLPLHMKMREYMHFAPIVKINPDIVHFEFGTLAHSLQNIKDYIDCKASVSFRGYDMNHVGIEEPTYYSKVWNVFDGFHFLGSDLKRRAENRGYNHNRGIEALIAPAVNTALFKPLADKKKVREKVTIVSTGRLIWKKGYEYGIRAVHLLKQRGIPVEYRIIGNGPYEDALIYTIHELGLRNEVYLLGRKNKEEIAEELNNADVFLHPAISEGFCNAVIEAQAMGVPVIASDAGGLPENIADGETGFIVPMWDVEAIADKVTWLWNNQASIVTMGAAGIERVKKNFTAENQIKQFTDFYQRVYES